MQFSTEDGTFYLVFLAVAGPLLAAVAAASTLRRRRKLSQTLRRANIVGEYKIPLQLSPAELGYMYEVKISKRQLLATLLDLEHRHIVSIDKRLQVTMLPQEGRSRLLPHEWLITKLVSDNPSIMADELLETVSMKEFEKRVRDSLVNNGYIKTRSVFSTLALGWFKMFGVLVIGLGVLFYAWTLVKLGPSSAASFLLIPINTAIVTIVFLPLVAVVAAILIVIHIYISGQSGLGTEKLLVDWSKVEGFRAFVFEAQHGTLRYSSDKLKQSTLLRVEAYAVAFGLHPAWRARYVPPKPALKIAEA